MLKKLIKYTDFDGNEREEEFYFNLTKAEVLEMEISVDGGLANRLKKIIAAKDTAEILKEFKEFVLKSYGEKSADGKRFIKSPELSEAFTQTEAYSTLFMEFLQNEQAAADFVNAIIPKDLDSMIKKQ